MSDFILNIVGEAWPPKKKGQKAGSDIFYNEGNVNL